MNSEALELVTETPTGLGYAKVPPNPARVFIKQLSADCYVRMGFPDGSVACGYTIPSRVSLAETHLAGLLLAQSAHVDWRILIMFRRLTSRIDLLRDAGWTGAEVLAQMRWGANPDPVLQRRAALDFDRAYSAGEWSEAAISAKLKAGEISGRPEYVLAWHAKTGDWQAFETHLERAKENLRNQIVGPDPQGVLASYLEMPAGYAANLRRAFCGERK